MLQATGIWDLLCLVLVRAGIRLNLCQSIMTDHSDTIKGIMGRETDYIERTIDTHIDEFEDLSVI